MAKIFLTVFAMLTIFSSILYAQHFQYEFSDVNASIIITEATINDQMLQNGDEIGVFTEGDVCAGAIVVEDEFPVGIAAWGEEEEDGVPGFEEGELMSFKFWDDDQEVEFDTEVTIILGEREWVGNGFYIMELAAIIVPEMVIEQEFLNFGLVEIDLNIDMNLRIENIGNDDLVIENIEVEGHFFSVEFDDEIIIESDEFFLVEVTFAADTAGEGEGVITITSNDPGNEEFQIPLYGFAVERIQQIPEEEEFGVLITDELECAVGIEDEVEFEISYLWTVNADTFGIEQHISITLEEIGKHEIQCQMSVQEYTATITWRVKSAEFYIASHEPENLSLTFRRDREINFSMDVRAIEGLEPNYRWILTDRGGRNNDIGEVAEVSYHFDLPGDYSLRGLVTHNDVADSIFWQISVRSLLYWWTPHEREIEIPINREVEFSVIPFNPESDLLNYLWYADGIEVSIEIGIAHTFRDTGNHSVVAIVQDGVEVDTVIWTVTAFNPDKVVDPASLLPTEVTLYPAAPNPFNSTINISFYLPDVEKISLRIFSIGGRKAADIATGQLSQGKHVFTWQAVTFPAGVYFIKLKSNNLTQTQKIVLLK